MKYDKSEKRLTAQQVARLVEPGRYPDGGGLYLQVRNETSRGWFYHYSLNKRSREMPLGSLRSVSLKDARDKMAECRKLRDQGVDPLEQRRADQAAKAAAAALATAKAITFKECAETYIAGKEKGWKNAKHAAQWSSTLLAYAYPVIGTVSVADVDDGLILRIIEPIWLSKTETAKRLRGRLEKILGWAGKRGYRSGLNPARWAGHLEHDLASPSKVAKVKHHAAISHKEVPAFMGGLRDMTSVSARALEFTILTAARTGETIGAEWSEFDLSEKMWNVPGIRMKGGVDHRVPLSERAVEVLAGMPQSGKYVFPGGKEGSPLSNMAMLELLRGVRKGMTVHGFRSSFMDWGHDMTGYPKELMDIALAHKVSDKVEAAYRRSDMIEKRRRLMQAWADYCAAKSVTADVLTINRAMA